MVRRYVPDIGDIVWLDFDPQAGREQAGRRSALVVSPILYNEKSGLGIFCPITSKVKGYPFEVLIPSGVKVAGAILCDHVKNLDWGARHAEYVATLPSITLEAVQDRLAVLLDLR